SRTSPGVILTHLDARANRTTARCGTHTPLGRPVDPEVYITYDSASGVIGTAGSDALSRPIAAALGSRQRTVGEQADSLSESRASVSKREMPASSSMNASRSAG